MGGLGINGLAVFEVDIFGALESVEAMASVETFGSGYSVSACVSSRSVKLGVSMSM